MPDDHVKNVAAVDTFWRTIANDLLDLIDGVVVGAAVEVDAGRLGLSCCRFAALAPNHSPVQHIVDIGEVADAVEFQAGDGERFVSASEQLRSDGFAVDHHIEFAMQLLAGRQAPDAASGATRRYFAVGVAAALEKQLRPHVDAAATIPTMVEIDSSKWIFSCEHVRDTVGMP